MLTVIIYANDDHLCLQTGTVTSTYDSVRPSSLGHPVVEERAGPGSEARCNAPPPKVGAAKKTTEGGGAPEVPGDAKIIATNRARPIMSSYP
jgi:hypothetical protein